MNSPLIDEAKKKMEKSLEAFQLEMSRLRTGRANLSLLDGIKVESYGQIMPLNQVATLGSPEPRLLTIAPWDASMISSIEKAIDKSQLGLNPSNDGKVIRLPIPALTEERRKELVKKVKQHAEEARIAVRHARREGLETAKKQEKESLMTEDESKKLSDAMQKVTDEYIQKIDQAIVKKEAEIMQV